MARDQFIAVPGPWPLSGTTEVLATVPMGCLYENGSLNSSSALSVAVLLAVGDLTSLRMQWLLQFVLELS